MNRSTSTAWLAYIVAQQHRWPPQFPQPRTLLTDHGTPALDVPADRGAWTAEHWQAYAEFLEQRGAEITRRVRAAEARAPRLSPAKAARTAKAIDKLYRVKKKPGRAPGSRYDEIALEALELQAYARAAGGTMTDKAALAAAYQARGQRASRADAGSAGTIINRMVVLRKANHEIPSRYTAN